MGDRLTTPNKALPPMPVGRPSSAFAVDIARPSRLSLDASLPVLCVTIGC
jgi:hypothetical protein